MWNRICIIIGILCWGLHFQVNAQQWQRDPSFCSTAFPNNVVYTSMLQSDGKIILAGSFTMHGNVAATKVIRLEPDGQMDTSFHVASGPNSHVYASYLQPDGYLLIAGQFTMVDTFSSNRIARLCPDGSLDTSFHVGIGPNSNILSMAYQSDGKILIAGTFTSINGISRNRIARLMHDGSLDTSFHVGSGANQSLWTVVLQSNGKILIGGGMSSYNGVARNRIARLNTDGSIDASFDPGTGAMSSVPSNAKVSGITIQPDGSILVCGKFQTFNEVSRNNIVRLAPDGSIDQTFLTTIGANDWIWNCALDSSSRILIAGYFTTYDGDSSKFIARLFSNGLRDTQFSHQIKLNNLPRTLLVQPDHKVLIGGHFTKINQDSIPFLARLSVTSPLPWVGISLRANSEENGVFLEWKSTSNAKDFLLQHSFEGDQFKSIEPANFLYSSKQEYPFSYIHLDNRSGTHCYRVIDNKNLEEQSPVVCLNKRDKEWTVYPNPAVDKIHIQISCEKKPSLQILNSMGKKVWWQESIEESSIEIDISSWPKGTYVARLITSKQKQDLLFTKGAD